MHKARWRPRSNTTNQQSPPMTLRNVSKIWCFPLLPLLDCSLSFSLNFLLHFHLLPYSRYFLFLTRPSTFLLCWSFLHFGMVVCIVLCFWDQFRYPVISFGFLSTRFLFYCCFRSFLEKIICKYHFCYMLCFFYMSRGGGNNAWNFVIMSF